MGMTLYGQNDIRFSFECNERIESPSKAKIILKSPDKESFNMFTDTIRNYSFSEKNFFKSKGKYTLSITFETEKYGKDSLDYTFELKGSEVTIVISVSFDYREKLIKEGDIYVKGEKILNGYVRLNKYYSGARIVEIEPDINHLSDEFYKGPFFKIKNKSSDTLYGEHLPGYFWGTLSYIRNDSILATRTGILDYEFSDLPPLYPDSTKLATVGSFGYRRKLIPFDYRFEVMLAKEWQSQGIGILEESENFTWWAGTKEYYKLIYDFKTE